MDNLAHERNERGTGSPTWPTVKKTKSSSFGPEFTGVVAY